MNAHIRAAYALLEWARTPCYHGGNPYCRADVVAAERLVAETEGREAEVFARVAPAAVERAEVAPRPRPGQGMARAGSAAGVSSDPAQLEMQF